MYGLTASGRAEDVAGLGAGAAAQFDDAGGMRRGAHYFVRGMREQSGFGARDPVFGQHRDDFEERRTDLIVKPGGWDGFLTLLREAAQDRFGEFGIDARDATRRCSGGSKH